MGEVLDDAGPHQKRRFDYSRLGFKSKPKIKDSVTLEIRKIPQELNTITKLNEHFGKFGNIVNIQVHFTIYYFMQAVI